jgi:putative ABC transport system permease protein
VLTDLDNGRAFLRTPPSHASYIVCKCRNGADRDRVLRAIQRALPEHEVISTEQFHERSGNYWTTRTSIGPLLALCSVLSVVVGFLIVMLAFYSSTIEKIPVFACMKALGASNGELVTILVLQAIIVLSLGCLLGGAGLYGATLVLAHTTISVHITRELVAAGLAVTILCSGTSSLLSIRRLIHADPGEAFR